MLWRMIIITTAFSGCFGKNDVTDLHRGKENFEEAAAIAKIHKKLTKHVHSLDLQFTVALKMHMRRLSPAPTCAWQNGKCSMNNPEGLFSNAPSGSVMGALWDKCSPCMNKNTLTECVTASKHCEWDGSECDCKNTEKEMQDAMGKLLGGFSSCGFFGKMMEALAECTTVGTAACGSNAKCNVKTGSDVPEGSVTDGMACDSTSSCEPTSAASNENMCPGYPDFDQLMTECQEILTTSGSTPENPMQQLANCLKDKCPVMGTMMDSSLNSGCSDIYVKSSCESPSAKAKGCKWDSNQCAYDMNDAMMNMMPDTCALKPLMFCSGIWEQTACKQDERCVWEASESCTDEDSGNPGIVEVKNECSIKDSKMFEAMAAGTCDPDAAIFAQAMKTEEACEAATTEAVCTAVKAQTVASGQHCSVITAASVSTSNCINPLIGAVGVVSAICW